jgi:GNAT superfamily N-acetyltransferase
MRWPVDIVQSTSASDIRAVQELWAEYWQSLGLSPDFQDFAEELRTLPGKYAPPAGRLLLVRIEGQPAGTAAFRPLRQDACEAKRLYVRPAWRRQGVAGSLLARLTEEARFAGYHDLYGDTLTNMAPALDLYRGMGFVEVGPYSDEPTPDAIYLRLRPLNWLAIVAMPAA